MNNKPSNKPKNPKRFSGEVSDLRLLDEMRALTARSPYSFNGLAEEAFRIALPILKQRIEAPPSQAMEGNIIVTVELPGRGPVKVSIPL
jgi:hypothetical protein